MPLLASGQVWAYCRTTTCDRVDAPPECGTPVLGQCSTLGKAIAWPNTCVSTSVSVQGSVKSHIDANMMRQIVEKAFVNWISVDCGGGTNPKFSVDIFPDVNCTEVTGDKGYKPTGPNYNIWIFHDTNWPPEYVEDNAIAITTTQFSPTTGEIFDSDVELNSEANIFTTDLAQAQTDLPSVVQHESGHFLGLAHSQVDAATMFPSLAIGDATKRTLEQDDMDAICAAYPPGKLNPNCDPEPRHGFSTECEFQKGCCTVAPGRSSGRHGSWGTILLGALVAIGASSRRRRRTSSR
jgi:hypothetical protein